MMHFDRRTFFDAIRGPLFGGSLTQQQVDGLNFKLGEWEDKYLDRDLRWLAYALATSKHETASTMWPVEEYGKGAGHDYGVKDPQTGWAYYGRGDVQLTHPENYQRATDELGLSDTPDDLYWHADRALDPQISADVMFVGMECGWFRGHKLGDYFNETRNDPYNARDIINGDKSKVPDWSGGVNIGNLIAGYAADFFAALVAAQRDTTPEPEPTTVHLRIELLVTIEEDGTATTEVVRTTME